MSNLDDIWWEIAKKSDGIIGKKSDEKSGRNLMRYRAGKFGGGGDWWKVLGFGTMVVMEPDMQHRMPWYDRYEASSGNFCQQCNVILGDFFKIQISNQH